METPARAGAPDVQNGEVDIPVSRSPADPATHPDPQNTNRRRARIALGAPIEVKKFFANRKGDVVVIAIRQIDDGPVFLDIRKYFTDKSGVTRPTRKGLSLAIVRLPELHDGIVKAIKVAEQLGFKTKAVAP